MQEGPHIENPPATPSHPQRLELSRMRLADRQSCQPHFHADLERPVSMFTLTDYSASHRPTITIPDSYQHWSLNRLKLATGGSKLRVFDHSSAQPPQTYIELPLPPTLDRLHALPEAQRMQWATVFGLDTSQGWHAGLAQELPRQLGQLLNRLYTSYQSPVKSAQSKETASVSQSPGLTSTQPESRFPRQPNPLPSARLEPPPDKNYHHPAEKPPAKAQWPITPPISTPNFPPHHPTRQDQSLSHKLRRSFSQLVAWLDQRFPPPPRRHPMPPTYRQLRHSSTTIGQDQQPAKATTRPTSSQNEPIRQPQQVKETSSPIRPNRLHAYNLEQSKQSPTGTEFITTTLHIADGERRLSLATHTGDKRSGNEDYAACAHGIWASPDGKSIPWSFAAVADGAGGLAYGEVASQNGTEAIVNALKFARFDSQGQLNLATFDRRSNQYLPHQTYACDPRQPHLMARYLNEIAAQAITAGTTTMTALLNVADQTSLLHAGDSRAYSYHHGQLSPLTQDDSWVNEQLRQGLLTPEQAASHPQKNLITNYLGHAKGLKAIPLYHAHSQILLLSDGVTNAYNDSSQRMSQVIAAALKKGLNPAKALVESCQGFRADNTTAVYLN